MEELFKAIASSNIEEKISLFPQLLEHGDSGIDYLIEQLEATELQIRAKAYELLQDIDLDKVRKAIANGLLLNPDDQVFSVYQAGMGFDDQEYYLVEDYVDYAHQIHKLIGINCYCDPRGNGIRKYCYLIKARAERATEALHRKIVKQYKGYHSDWRKENPDFNPKRWCADNKIAYNDEWEKYSVPALENLHAIYEIKQIIHNNDELRDDFRKNRYIYHP